MAKKSLLLIIMAVSLVSFFAVRQTSADVLPARINTLTSTAMPAMGQTTASKGAIMQRFRDEIKTIKDERKKALVQRISDRISEINTRLTTRMTNSLNRMTALLTNLKTKSSELKTAGKDTAALDAAITSAETAITNAQALVNSQSQKTYSADIISDTSVKSPIAQMFSQFKIDILAAYNAVVSARQAVANALSEHAKLEGGTNTATGSATISPTTTP